MTVRKALIAAIFLLASAALVACRWPETGAARKSLGGDVPSPHHTHHGQPADRPDSTSGQSTKSAQAGLSTKLARAVQATLQQHQAELHSLGTGEVLNCTLDTTLPQPPAATKFLVAALLHNNEAILANFVPQLLAVIAAIPEGNVFVSVYESGSTDETGKGVTLLKAMLDELRIAKHVVVGGEKRSQSEKRIAFLARLRNLALAPLWDSTMGSAPFPADRIVFINDILFCAGDILRLMASTGDMVCAMDMHTWRTGATWPEFNLNYHPFGPFGPRLAEEMEAHKEHLLFYDTWVTRDALGLPFSNFRPFVHHQYSLQRLQAGLPFPVTCCWNGVVVLGARPFIQGGLRFRASDPGECEAGEVGNMCKDLLLSGHRHMLLDAGVRVAYTHESAEALHGPMSSFISETTWADVQAAGHADMTYVPEHTMLTCCPLLPELDIIKDWNTCYPTDIHRDAANA